LLLHIDRHFAMKPYEQWTGEDFAERAARQTDFAGTTSVDDARYRVM
jgi:hypothetical protein